MINKVSFAGREGLLTENLREMAQKKPATSYISESSVLPQLEEGVQAVKDISSEKLNEAYRAAHAPFLKTTEKEVAANEFILDGQQLAHQSEQVKEDIANKFIVDGQQY